MCNNYSDADLRAENEALKKQVSALTHALETHNRNNQPYILQLKSESDAYRRVIEQILLEMEYGPSRYCLPSVFVNMLANTLRENEVCIVTNVASRSLGIYLNPQNATGGDKPEQEQ